MKGAAAVLMLTVLSGCGGDAEENLLSLPDRVAELCREGAWDDAWDFVADEFEAHSIIRAQARVLVPRYLGESGYVPYVAYVTTDPDREGEDTRTLSVMGVLCRGDPTQAKPRQIRPFRLEIEVRRDGDDWLAVSATVHR